MDESAATTRTVLLLQGPSSLFFRHLADALEARGAQVRRINLCTGDWLFWRRPGARNYRGDAAAWPGYLAAVFEAEHVTDLVLLGDCRERHKAAIALARRTGIRVHAIELGYLRPDWLTIEREGTGGFSRFPRDPAAIRRLATGPLPATTRLYRSSFLEYAALDVAFNLANVVFDPLFFPRFRRHAIDHPVVEYAGWIVKLVRGPAERRRTAATLADVGRRPGPRFLVPLQLATDFQIRVHAPDPDLVAMMKGVVRSFAREAPPDATLLFKVHPLDNGWIRWRRLLIDEAATAGVAGRCFVVDGGDLGRMLDGAAGVVTVNSTVGITALVAGVPVLTLGTALYDVAGLTHRGPKEAFWQRPERPDPTFVTDFLRALAATIQVRGAFDGEGVRPGAAAVAERILRDRDPLASAAGAAAAEPSVDVS